MRGDADLFGEPRYDNRTYMRREDSKPRISRMGTDTMWASRGFIRTAEDAPLQAFPWLPVHRPLTAGCSSPRPAGRTEDPRSVQEGLMIDDC